MKFFAIIFLATLSYIDNPDKTENLYSYQLQFQSYDNHVGLLFHRNLMQREGLQSIELGF